MAESTEKYLDWDWGSTPAAKPGEGSFYGDRFPDGVRFQFKVLELSKSTDEDTGRKRVLLIAECIKGAPETAETNIYKGRVLKSTFSMPLKADIADPKKNYGARLLRTLLNATDNDPGDKKGRSELEESVGKLFEATTQKDTYAATSKKKKDADGNEKEFPGTDTSKIKDIYEVGGSKTADREPVKTRGESDFDLEEKED